MRSNLRHWRARAWFGMHMMLVTFSCASCDSSSQPSSKVPTGLPPLQQAMWPDNRPPEQKRDAVLKLLGDGADPNADGGGGLVPLMTAWQVPGDAGVAIARALLAAGADPNRRDQQGLNVLSVIVSHGRRDIATLLLAAGADPNARDSQGRTPLWWAVSDAALTELLIASGAEVNVADRHGYTPLGEAAANGSVDVIRALVRAGANVDAQNRHGETPMFRAVALNRPEAVTELARLGANTEICNMHGETALIAYAGSFGRFESLQALVQSGANVSARAKNGDTALDRARTIRAQARTAEMLLAATTRPSRSATVTDKGTDKNK
jgi:cytohesin